MRVLFIFVVILFAFSCSSKPEQKPGSEEIKTYDTSIFYYDIPLAVKNEIDEIKRTFAFTYSIITENGKRDSTVVDTTALMQLAAPFLQYNLNESKHRKYYKENRFQDGDTKSIVFTYETNHPDLPVKTATVLLDNETENLKRIDVMKAYVSKDTTFEERLSWTAGESFQVVQLINIANKEIIKQTQVFWRDR